MRALFLCFLMTLSVSAQALADTDLRTSGRSIDGKTVYPAHLFTKPEFDEFLEHNSNHDPQNQHPQQWQGQDWDEKAWQGSGWTTENTLKNLFQNDVFRTQFIRSGHDNSIKASGVPVLVLGPTFYKLSNLDQRRSVKLLVDRAGLFNRGYSMVELQDWYNKKAVGNYTPRGLFMN
jgi:hypothetical protein